MALLVVVAALLALLAAPAALTEVIATPPPSKICAGPNGSTITWNIGLNHGWRPSKKLHYRLTLLTPRGTRVGFYYKTTGGYYDMGAIDSYNVITNYWYHPPTPGLYTLVLETKIDKGYPDLYVRGDNDGPIVGLGRWYKWRPWHVRAYSCQ